MSTDSCGRGSDSNAVEIFEMSGVCYETCPTKISPNVEWIRIDIFEMRGSCCESSPIDTSISYCGMRCGWFSNDLNINILGNFV